MRKILLIDPKLVDLLLEQVNLRLVIREPKSPRKTIKQVRKTLARITSAIEANYKISEENKRGIYLDFLNKELVRRRWEAAKPDCAICDNWYDFIDKKLTSGCQVDKEAY